MIRKTLVFCAAVALGTVLSLAQAPATSTAQTPPRPTGPAPTKIGFLDSLRIVYETDEGKTEIAKVQEFINKKQSEYDTRKTDLDKLSEQYQNQQRTLNPETRDEMEKAIQTRDKELKRFQEDTQAEIDRQRDAILGKLGQKIQGLIDDYARENGYAAIFVRGQSQTYVAPSLDITEEVIRRYNQKFPAKPPATPVAPAKKP